MLKFNNDNIFTGYLKQLLHTFNLPKYRVYTDEQQKFHNNYTQACTIVETKQEELKNIKKDLAICQNPTLRKKLVEQYKITLAELTKARNIISNGPELNVLATIYRNEPYLSYRQATEIAADKRKQNFSYPKEMRYIQYIKDNKIQIYAPKIVDGEIYYSDNDWKLCHADLPMNHMRTHSKSQPIFLEKNYSYDLKINNYTKNLKITNDIYDSYTHEYLGDYLRFHRDYLGINLMSLYNCFSNRSCSQLDVSIVISPDKIDEETGKKIKGYTANFKTTDTNYKIYIVPIKLFQQYTIAIDCEDSVEMCCGLYGQYQYDSKYDILMHDTYVCYDNMQFNKPILFDKVKNLSKYATPFNSLELAQHEDDLKLFIKLPFSNKSSITILEGNYCNYNDTLTWLEELKKVSPKDPEYGNIAHKSNHTIFNFDGDYAEITKQFISPLQLLKINTGTSYPFADRLIEYLVGNAITPTDGIADNIERAKVVVAKNCKFPSIIQDGIWDDVLPLVFYNYIVKNYDKDSINHDILGYVDKEVEKLYSYTNNKTDQTETISSVNIYKDEWEE